MKTLSIFWTRGIAVLVLLVVATLGRAQDFKWAKDGNAYYKIERNEIVQYTLPANTKKVIVSAADLTQNGRAIGVRAFYFSADQSKLLIYTNSQRVWRLDTRGDYWVLDVATKKLKQLGNGLAASSLMFAKFSPDAQKVAYVYQNNVLVEDLASGDIARLTTVGTRKLINGTFDWAYEEEFACRDGFQWSPDGKHIAFWQIDATTIPDFFMINNTDSVYARLVPVEYPTAGKNPSPARIGIATVATKEINWLGIPGDPQQHYIPRIEWNAPGELFVQQLNRKQNESKIFKCNVTTNNIQLVYTETDEAWIDAHSGWEEDRTIEYRHEFLWINGKKEFLWLSEKDGWRHLYRITKDGKETLVTPGAYDVMDLRYIDERNNTVYFIASPDNATQRYLYKTKLDGKGKAERVSPAAQNGTHDYSISPSGKFAWHDFTNTFTKPVDEFIALPDHKAINKTESIDAKLASAQEAPKVEFFKIKTSEGVEMDGWMVKPKNFDATKKYPVLFLVYSEPAGANVRDVYGIGRNRLFNGDLAAEGYIYMTIDNRGTPAPKGRTWRKSIYKQVGRLNIKDQALAAQEVLKWSFVDHDRVAVWGWSGGGSATLNLMFQYPDIYKTGISVAAISNLLTYDNIYEERYMGLPQENMADYIAGSPNTYAKNLKGNLLYIHGTGDDNVHYSNADMLINELVKHNKQFQFMAYPNRTHSISEGEGTRNHLSTLYTDYLRKYCPPGAK